jgi:hypothetical protein
MGGIEGNCVSKNQYQKQKRREERIIDRIRGISVTRKYLTDFFILIDYFISLIKFLNPPILPNKNS